MFVFGETPCSSLRRERASRANSPAAMLVRIGPDLALGSEWLGQTDLEQILPVY
jgi:hypothetical protein